MNTDTRIIHLRRTETVLAGPYLSVVGTEGPGVGILGTNIPTYFEVKDYSPTGGATVVYAPVMSGENLLGYVIGVATCTNSDRFVKRTGREIAMARLQKGKGVFLTCTDQHMDIRDLLKEKFAECQEGMRPGVCTRLRQLLG